MRAQNKQWRYSNRPTTRNQAKNQAKARHKHAKQRGSTRAESRRRRARWSWPGFNLIYGRSAHAIAFKGREDHYSPGPLKRAGQACYKHQRSQAGEQLGCGSGTCRSGWQGCRRPVSDVGAKTCCIGHGEQLDQDGCLGRAPCPRRALFGVHSAPAITYNLIQVHVAESLVKLLTSQDL